MTGFPPGSSRVAVKVLKLRKVLKVLMVLKVMKVPNVANVANLAKVIKVATMRRLGTDHRGAVADGHGPPLKEHPAAQSEDSQPKGLRSWGSDCGR